MSELKGQILGIVLVISIFGAIAGSLVTLFTGTITKIQGKVDAEISKKPSHYGNLTF